MSFKRETMSEGFIKLDRKALDSPYFLDAETFKFWVWLLLNAAYKPRTFNITARNGAIMQVSLERGELIFGRKSASKSLGISESKLERLLKKFSNDKAIVRKPDTNYSIITVCNYALYQDKKDKGEHQADTKRTPSGHQADTSKNSNKNSIKKYSDIEGFPQLVEAIVDHLNSKTGRTGDKQFKYTSAETQSAIYARLKEQYAVVDFYKVIDHKVKEWKNTDFAQYLTPDTLFRKKNFPKYLDQATPNTPVVPITKPLAGGFNQYEDDDAYKRFTGNA